MSEKTPSQQAARFMEIACYFLLVPATFSLLISLLTIVGFFFALPIYLYGCLLLHSYRQHSRENLSRPDCVWMWNSTIILNLIQIPFFLFGLLVGVPFLLILAFFAWTFIAVVTAAHALASDSERNE